MIIIYISEFLNDFYTISFIWIVIWRTILSLHPGTKEINSILRLHFSHGIVSSIFAILCLLQYVSENITIGCLLGYLLTDLSNMIMNDFYYKVNSYHTPTSRKIEYFHHSLCIIVSILSKSYTNYCLLDRNPLITVILAEISTPFLIAYRWSNQKNIILGSLFFVSFIGIRTIYQCIFFMPYIFNSCSSTIGYMFVIPYVGLQIVFTYQIVNKAFFTLVKTN